MIKSFRIVNNLGESLELDIRKPEDSGFLVVSVTGLSYLQAEISTSEIALFDGSILGNRRVGKRNIVMTISFYQENKQKLTIEELRHKCYRYFPIKQQITFYAVNDSGTYRISGYIEANETNIFTKEEGAQISILCPDPYFVRVDTDVKQLVSKIIPNFCFPCSFEFEGEPVLGYPNKYEGPFVIVPDSTDKEIQTEFGYTYGDITVTRYMIDRSLNTAGGDTAIIKGDDSVPEIIPTEPENANWHFYDGPDIIIPRNENLVLPTKETYITDDIIVKAIPIKRTKIVQDGYLDHYNITIGNTANG